MKVAIIGASGAVGREILNDLEDSDLPASSELHLFASPRSAGQGFTFREKSIHIKPWSLEAIKGFDYILMSAGGDFSRKHALEMTSQGSTIIDNSSAWRMDKNCPLVVPEVNGSVLKDFKNGIIANPNCSTIQMVVSLKPLQEKFGLKQLMVSTYQSVSGSGQKGIEELGNQIQSFMKFQNMEANLYPQPIAFNTLPAIGDFSTGKNCEEEAKLVNETKKILSLPDLPIMATTVRVPVFKCHGESIFLCLNKKVSLNEVEDAFRSAKGLTYIETSDHSKLPSPHLCSGEKGVFVSRLRLSNEGSSSDWLQYWNIADNLKKGAATNAVQILETLIKNK